MLQASQDSEHPGNSEPAPSLSWKAWEASWRRQDWNCDLEVREKNGKNEHEGCELRIRIRVFLTPGEAIVLTCLPEMGRNLQPGAFSPQRALVPAACHSVYCSGRWPGHKKCAQPACHRPLLLGPRITIHKVDLVLARSLQTSRCFSLSSYW